MFKAFRSRIVVLSGTLAMLLAFLTSLSVGATAVASSAVHSSTSSKAFTPAPSNTAVLTYKNDTSHSGWNSHETILTPQNVKSQSFGLHGAYNVDGQVYAQPLYVPNLNGHNVVFVATEHDSLYEFDADGGGLIWQKNFLINGAVSVTNTDVSCNDMVPLVGITSTPVIDLTTNTIYLVAFTKENGQLVYRLHALDLTTGNEKFGGPKVLSASGFNTHFERQRANLLLSQGNIYIAFSSFCDNIPYHGFILSYSASTLAQLTVYNDTPNGSDGGIWGAAGTMAADASGNIYVMVGNGTFDLNSGGPDAGDSFLKLSPSLKVLDYFAPFNQSCLSAADADLGSGGVLLLPDHTELLGAGKQGRIYVLNAGSMGHYRSVANACSVQNQLLDSNVKQELSPGIGGVYSTPATWNGVSGEYVYVGSADHSLRAFQVNADGTLVTTPSSLSAANFAWPGANPVVSSNGGSAGIVWAVDSTGVLHAYDATNLTKELYNSAQQSARDGMDNFQKFADPTVANGEVFVGTQDRLYVYGELPVVDPGYNNIGISNDTSPTLANFDGNGFSYSAQTLQNVGLMPGATIVNSGFTFTWPAPQAGQADNRFAFGQTVSVNAPAGQNLLGFLGSSSDGNGSGTLTLNYADGTSATTSLGFTDWAVSPAAFGNQVVAMLPYRNGAAGKQTLKISVFLAEVSIDSTKTLQSMVLPRTVSGGMMHIFAFATQKASGPPPTPFNNAGISNDSNTTAASFDLSGNSYSFQALQSQNVNPGSTVSFNGVSFTWPNVSAGTQDNYVATGQTVSVALGNNESILAFLGAAINGNTAAQGTINYVDGTTQTFTLNFSDWTLGGGSQTPAYGNGTVIKTPYRNTPSGKQTVNTYVFYTAVALINGRTVKSVTLPNNNHLHVFSLVAYSAASNTTYNNMGISDDSNTSGANFDNVGYSYSAEALQAVGVTPNCSINFSGYGFTWPNVPSQAADNYQVANGLVLPVSTVAHPTGLAFLGAATNGQTSLQVTVTYADNTTQTFTLIFSDWTLNGGTVGVNSNDQVVAKTAYRNSVVNGRQVVSTYVFFTQISLTDTSGVQRVTFSNLSGGSGSAVHIFAIGGK